jgi:hypothetical protein
MPKTLRNSRSAFILEISTCLSPGDPASVLRPTSPLMRGLRRVHVYSHDLRFNFAAVHVVASAVLVRDGS